jgi:hypothetical protein
MTQMFDPNTFLEMTTTDANSTVAVPVPVGEYLAVIEKIEARPWQSKKDPSKAGMALDITWNIDDANVKALLDREKVTVKQGLMLDVTDAGGLDMGKGKNIGLGKLREALDMNQPGQPFGFKMMEGRMARIAVSHRSDDNDSSRIYAEVKAVARPS